MDVEEKTKRQLKRDEADKRREHVKNMWNSLRDRFPLVLKSYTLQTIVDQRGIELDLGWYGILDGMCRKLQKLLTDKRITDFCIVQIKQKFAALTIYHNKHDDADICKIIGDAVKEAQTTCEICGGPGNKHGKGYMRILCDDHVERESRRE